MAEAVKPSVRRRRVLHPSAVVPVPVYSNKVSSSLQLKPTAALLCEESTDDGADDSLWAEFSPRVAPLPVAALSDSEDDAELSQHEWTEPAEEPRCLTPPPPESPVQKRSRKVTQKINEVNRRLQAVSSILSPEPQSRRSRTHRTAPPGLEQEDPDDDVIIMSPPLQHGSDPAREIPLKIRCRTDVHKIPVQSSTQIHCVVKELSIILEVPPPRLLLLRNDVELPTDCTVGQLGLGITDIIECVVMAAEDEDDSSIIIKLQSKDRDSSQEFSIHREAPLGSVFSRYLSHASTDVRRNVCFQFDGSRVTAGQTPAQLDMEDGDIIEVWT
ncbi:NFATC2-interacting protein [Austrofundulus limnaeus]|uniref:NFATC2-interacting protein n=1 Tax=Austrofundulus limnaeus TaxID=52670 RepID=A0A2I4D7E0_AUSLI|nr:PREDICTED: NFATC2-interacting protein [Austrofundulus limnaeus]